MDTAFLFRCLMWMKDSAAFLKTTRWRYLAWNRPSTSTTSENIPGWSLKAEFCINVIRPLLDLDFVLYGDGHNRLILGETGAQLMQKITL